MGNRKLAYANSLAGLLSQLLLVFFQFVQRKLFLSYLSVEILGISGTLSSLIAAVSLAEGGIGSAIIYNLYKPLSENDIKQINKLMNIYRFLYHLMAGAVIIFAFCVCPFLPQLLSGIEFYYRIYVYFFLIVAGTALEYLMSYRRALYTADRHEYICKIIDFGSNFIFFIIRIVILVKTRNYMLFLIANLGLTLTSNGILYWLSKKRYPFLLADIHDKILLKKLWPQMRELFNGQIAAYVYNSSDNIVISKFVSTISVGLMSNYTMVTVHLKNIILSIFGFCGPMLGNIIANTERHDKRRKEYFDLYSFGLYVIVMILIVPEAILLNYFVENVWGKQYLMSSGIAALLILDQYITIVQDSCGVYIIADGKFKECKRADGVAAFLNIIISVGLVFKYQIVGVLLGTVISRFVQWMMKAYYVNQIGLSTGWTGLIKYWVKNVYKFMTFGVALWIISIVVKYVRVDGFPVRFLLVGVISVGISMLCLILFWAWTEEKLLVLKYIKR